MYWARNDLFLKIKKGIAHRGGYTVEVHGRVLGPCTSRYTKVQNPPRYTAVYVWPCTLTRVKYTAVYMNREPRGAPFSFAQFVFKV